MKTLLLAMGLILSALNTTAFAADCISQQEMTEIASHFKQFSKLARNNYCYDGSQESHLLATIMFMRKNPFAADMKPSSDELFSGRFSQNWYNYFIGRINQFNVQKNCPKGVGAYVYGFGNTMYVCPMMLTESFSAIDRASIFMHEARHIDGFPHVTCSRGARQGLDGACDERISDGGSYAVTVETYSQLAKYATDLHPALKAYSMASAVTYADEAFEVPAKVTRQAKLLLMTKSKDLFSLDPSSENRIETLGQSPALGHVVSRAQHLILIPDDKNLPARYLFTKNEGEISQSAGESITEYNGQSPSERSRLVDLHIGAQWSAKIYNDKVKFACDPNSPSAAEMPFNGVTPVGIIYSEGYSRTSYLNYLMTSNGTTFEFGCNSRRAFLRPSNLKLDANYKRMQKVGNVTIALTQDGNLAQIDGTKVTPIKTALDGQIYEIAPRQTFQFMDAQ